MKKLIFFLIANLYFAMAFAQVPTRFPGGIIAGKVSVISSTNDSVLLGAGGRKALSTFSKVDTTSLSNRINVLTTSKQDKLSTNQSTVLSNLTGINFNTVPKSIAGGYSNSSIVDNGTSVIASLPMSASNLSGTNTGDETLTTIKTKLGAASSLSDGYIKYQDWVNFNSKQPAGAYLTDVTSGQVTTALGYTPWWFSNHPTTLSGYGITDTPWTGYLPIHSTADNSIDWNGWHASMGTIYDESPTSILAYYNDGSKNIQTFSPTAIKSWLGLGSNAYSSVSYQPLENQRLRTTDSPTFGSIIASSYIPSFKIISSQGTQDEYNFQSSYWIANDLLIRNTTSNQSLLGFNRNGNAYFGYNSDQGYKLAVNGTGYFNGDISATTFTGSGSGLTGVVKSLTTTGTSGAATLSNGVLNVPNYANGTATIYQTQTTVNGSISGSIVCSMPFQTGSYKKVIIKFLNFKSDTYVSYTYPTAFIENPGYFEQGTINGYVASIAKTAYSALSPTNALNGVVILEGY